MNSDIEKRREPRIPMRWPAILMASWYLTNGMTKDISMGGALFLCSEPLQTDGELNLTIKLTKKHKISIPVKKIWSTGLHDDNSFYCKIGFRFTKISTINQKVLAFLVNRYS